MIVNVNPNTSGSGLVFLDAAEWGWASSDAATSIMQMQLLGRYRAWFAQFRRLFAHPTPLIAAKIEKSDEFVRRWIERDGTWDHSIPATIGRAREIASEQMAAFTELLDLAAANATGQLRLVPDTNALIRNPDVASYGRTLGTDTFLVHLVPTVLGELDVLKDRGKTPELRTQAQGVIRRLKGLRDKGNLAAGVKVTRSVTVQTEAREVDVRSVLDWLDPSVPDDRILAAALRLQSEHPASPVVLVSSDLNLQNKADAVGLPYVETPPSPASQRAELSASIVWRSADGQGHSPYITLRNVGPAAACEIDYDVSTPIEAGPPLFKAGPWHVPRLGRGETDEQAISGFYPEVVAVTATWRDGNGENELSWPIDFPPRPERYRPAPRRIR